MKLKKQEIAVFKDKLLELRKQVVQSIQELTEDVKDIDASKGYSQRKADEGVDDTAEIISSKVTNKEYSILDQIDAALKKIEDGTYGVCEVSGEPIPKARLEAIPYASMTVQAQEKMEKGLL